MIPNVQAQPAVTDAPSLAPTAAHGEREFETRTIGIDRWHEFAQSQADRMIFHHRCWIELLMEHVLRGSNGRNPRDG